MKASELVTLINNKIDEYGDLEVRKGYDQNGIISYKYNIDHIHRIELVEAQDSSMIIKII